MIKEFSSVFEILTILNLGYATSESFRETIDHKILRQKDYLSEKYKKKKKQLSDTITVVCAGEGDGKLRKQCSKMDRYFEFSVKKLEQRERESSNFTKGTKTTFLVVSIYCFYCLLLGGYEQFYTDFQAAQFLVFIDLNIFIILALFFRNLIPKYHQKNIRPFYVVLFFNVPVVLYGIYISVSKSFSKPPFYPHDLRMIATIAVLFSLLAFGLHFLRVLIHRNYFKLQYSMVYSKARRGLRRVEKTIDYVKNLEKKPSRFEEILQLFGDIFKRK